MSFKFIQNNDSFSWESDSIKVEFSSPSIQPFKSNMIMTSSKDIMYYYYVVSIYKNVFVDWTEDFDEIREWKLVTSRGTHDFDCVRDLQFILNEMLTNNSIEDCQKIKYQNGNIEYQKVLRTEGFGCDDYYEITKIRNEKDNKNNYHVYVGCAFDINSIKENVGIKTEFVSTEDLKALKECVDNFISYSIKSENYRTEQRNKLIKESFEVLGDKLYQYEYSESEHIVHKDVIKSIYSVGDFVDIDTVELEDYFCSKQIIDITKKYIYLSDNIKIKTSDIIYIFNEISDEKLKYNVSQIKEYLMSKMDENIINDFKSLNENMLIKKYTSAIIDSVWLCREEHNLPHIVKGNNVKNAEEYAKNIILDIRNELLMKGDR